MTHPLSRELQGVPAIRIEPANPNHHLWNNNGTYWCHWTEHLPDYTKRRVRLNLHTDNPTLARFFRDSLFAELGIHHQQPN